MQADVSRIINAIRITTDEKTQNQFAIPDIIKLTNSNLSVGDKVIIPLNRKYDNFTIWETGGKRADSHISNAVIVAGPSDQLLNAILFNKLNRKPNGKHAVMVIKPGYALYVGKIVIKKSILAPTFHIIKLVFNEVDEDLSMNTYDGITNLGYFTVMEIFNDYGSIIGNVPAERLVAKLFTDNVMRPFYANGWSISETSSTRNNNQDIIVKNYKRINDISTEIIEEHNADKYLDIVEEHIATSNNSKLSSVLQIIDFEKNIMEIKTLVDLDMKNINESMNNAVVDKTFKTKLDGMLNCYNKNILFNSDNLSNLEISLSYDSKYGIRVDDRKYVLLRAWRG